MSDVERQLRDLGERIDERIGAPPTAPESVAKRAGRRRLSAGLGALALAAAVAVGSLAAFRSLGSEVDTIGPNVLLAAADATESQRTAKMTMNAVMAFDGAGFDNEVEMKGVGEVDFDKNRSRTLVSAEMPMVGKQQFETIQAGTTTYTKGLPGTDPDKWARAEAQGGALSGLSGTGGGGPQQNPEDYLEYLRSVSGDVQVIGADEIDGATVTHYRAEISRDVIEEGLGRMPDEIRSQFDNYDFEFDPVEVWIDGNNLVRRIDFGMTVEMSMDGSGFNMDMTFSTRFHDFGSPVDIQIPDESDVVDQPNPFEAESGASLEAESEVSLEAPVESDEGPSDMEGTILLGEDRLDGPTITFASSESRGLSAGCFMRIPRWVVRAELVEDPTGRVLMSAEEFTGESNRNGCVYDDLSEVVEDVMHSPTDYSIRLAAVGRTETIDIVDLIRPRDEP